MVDIYTTSDGDMIDEICWRHYPKQSQSQAVALVYESNNRLADLGAILPAGLTLVLPDLPQPRFIPTINLWGM